VCCILVLSFFYQKLNNDVCIYNFSSFLQKRMKETECTLADLEAKYMKANNTIKEKQYLIENLLKSG